MRFNPSDFRHATQTRMSDAPPKKLTGIQMPLDISTALAKVIGTKKGEQVSRPQVVKKLWAYLKEKELQVGVRCDWFT